MLVMPTSGAGGGTVLDRLPKQKRTQLDQHDAQAEGHQQLVLRRARVEVADDDALGHHAHQHHEQRAGDDGQHEGAAQVVGHPAGVAAQHEHRAVREVEHAQRAVDDGQAGGDQRQQGAEHQPVEQLRDEVGPVEHADLP